RKGADRQLAAMRVGALNPAIERFAVGEVGVDHALQQLSAEIQRGFAVEVFHDAPRQRIGRSDVLQTLPQVRVAIEVQTLADLNQEVDDLRQLDVEQWRQLRARHHDRVEVDGGGGEVRAEVA